MRIPAELSSTVRVNKLIAEYALTNSAHEFRLECLKGDTIQTRDKHSSCMLPHQSHTHLKIPLEECYTYKDGGYVTMIERIDRSCSALTLLSNRWLYSLYLWWMCYHASVHKTLLLWLRLRKHRR